MTVIILVVNMKDLIIVLIIAAILGFAIFYIVRSKKRGGKCIGCPDSSSCTGNCPGCEHK